jgi:hypothetical protein
VTKSKNKENKVTVSTTPFEPTQEQRDIVRNMRALNVKNDIIRIAIINPATNQAISEKTYYKVFERELEDHKAYIAKEFVVTWVTLSKHPDPMVKMKALDKLERLGLKGVFEPKFGKEKFSAKAPAEKIAEVTEAIRNGLISTYEADALIGAIKAEIDAQKLDKGVRDITISIDQNTMDSFAKALDGN